jgi:DNA-binding NarL/FixJ family response regulator
MASSAAAVIGLYTASRAAQRRIRVVAVGFDLISDGLVATIDREQDMREVATASTGDGALANVRWHRPDVVALDLLLPDMLGEDLARRILAEYPRTRVVAITSAPGHLHARRALDAGVHGYLSNRVAGCELASAIRGVQAGGRAVPGPVALRAAGKIRDIACGRMAHV